MAKTTMSRWYFGVLYEDSGAETLDIVKGCSHAYIWHRGEVDKNGETLKDHCHYLVYFENARRHTAVASFLKTEERLVVPSRTPDENFRYLIHADNPEKKQYAPSEVSITKNLERRFHKALDNLAEATSEDQKALQILEVLRALPRDCSYTDFFEVCCHCGYYGTFRAMGYGVTLQLYKDYVTSYGKYGNHKA